MPDPSVPTNTAKQSLGRQFRMKFPPLIPRPPEIRACSDCSTHETTTKKTRASKPKVRTGCYNCKIRHIKCDERRPTCVRCNRVGTECGGYEMNVAKSKIIETSGRILYPKKNPTLSSLHGQDVVYFDLFRNQLASDLSGCYYSDFWSRIVLCESMTNECVRESVIAIGALSQAVSFVIQSPEPSEEWRRPSALYPWTVETVVNDHHKVALHHHIKAISIFRQRIRSEKILLSPRSVLITTLLLIAFELLQGNMKMADGLMTSGINLLKDSLGLCQRDSSLQQKLSRRIVTTIRVEDDIDDIEHMLPSLSIMSGYTPFLGSQLANIVLWDNSAGRELPVLGDTDIKNLEIQWGKFFTRGSSFIGQAFIEQVQNLPTDIAVAEQEQQTFLSHLKHWGTVLDSYLAAAIRTNDDRAKRTIQMLRIHHLNLYICISCVLDRTEIAWDNFDTEFLTIIRRSLGFLTEVQQSYRAHFTLSTGLISPLGVVIVRCRNHNIRMMGAELLHRLSWREGAWDAKTMITGKLGGALLEERGRDCSGHIPPRHRWNWIGGDWDTGQRRLVAQYVRVVPDEKGIPVEKTLVLGLDDKSDVCSEALCVIDHAAECDALAARVKLAS